MYVSQELFRQAVDTLAHLRREDSLRILIGDTQNRGMVQFELRGTDVPESEVAERGLLGAARLEEATDDIADILGLLISGRTVDEIVEVRSNHDRLYDDESEDPQNTRAKVEIVEGALDVSELRTRGYSKRYSRVPIVSRFDWEVSQKLADDRWPITPQVAPLGLALLTVERAAGDFYDPESTIQVAFAVDIEDVGYIVDSLTRLKEALLKAEQLKTESTKPPEVNP